MAIAFDSASSKYESGTVSSTSLSHTCSGANRFLVVGVRTYGGDYVSGVTYNGVAMTSVGVLTGGNLGTDRLRTYYLIAPASGTNNVVVSFSPDGRADVVALSLTGALQSSQPDASGSATGSSATATRSITTATDNAWSVMAVSMNGASGAFSTGTNWTFGSGVNDRSGIGYGGPKTPAGAFSQTANLGGAGGWGVYQVAVKPALTTDYSITAAVGAFTLTGIAAAFLKALKIVANAGAFTLTGIAANLVYGRGIIAGAGSFALTGLDAALSSGRKIAAVAGSFVLTGIDASLIRGRMMRAATGAFALTFGILRNWRNLTKSSSTWTNGSKNSAAWTNTDKND
jgi:hypothetical protein